MREIIIYSSYVLAYAKLTESGAFSDPHLGRDFYSIVSQIHMQPVTPVTCHSLAFKQITRVQHVQARDSWGTCLHMQVVSRL